MSNKKDFYTVLGVQKNADDDALKKAYRKLAMEYHPDRNKDSKDAEARFKEINEAYDILKDPQKRAAYDRMGHSAFEGGFGGAGAGQGHPFGGGFGQGAGFEDMFEDILSAFGGRAGGAPRRDGPQRGSDLRYNLTIDLEDAYKGKTVKVRIPTSEACEDCNGSGAKKGTSAKTCGTCNGAGQVQYRQGFFSISRTCHVCNGAGKTIPDPCTTCRGAGRVQKDKTISVNIPKGVDSDTRVRLTGEGDAGVNGGPHGDLYIFITLRKHDLFQREGADLFMEVPVTFADATLGTKIEVPTLDGGRLEVTVPEGTQPGEQIRLKNKGMPVVNSGHHGDLYVEVSVEVPTKLSKEQRKLLEEFREASEAKNHPAHDSFFKKLGRFFEAS